MRRERGPTVGFVPQPTLRRNNWFPHIIKVAQAVAAIPEGAVLMIGGFMGAGSRSHRRRDGSNRT